MVGVLLLLTLILYKTLFRIKKVHLDYQYLYVSDFRKEIRIPLNEINYVTDLVIFSPRLIFVNFKEKTEFGNKIVFVGYTEIFLFFSTHPAVDEIKDKVKVYEQALRKGER